MESDRDNNGFGKMVEGVTVKKVAKKGGGENQWKRKEEITILERWWKK